MELNFVQIQVVTINGNILMYGLDSKGKMWHKQHSDSNWQKMSMTFNCIKEKDCAY